MPNYANELLKNCLLMTYTPTTDIMKTMLIQLPDEPSGKLFIALYLQPLPATLWEQVTAKKFTDPVQVA